MRQLAFLSIVIFLLCFSLGCQQKAEEATSQPEAAQSSGSEDAEPEGSGGAEPSETNDAEPSGAGETEPTDAQAEDVESDEPVAVAQEQEDDTTYHFVPPSELEFSIEDFYYNAMVGEGGTAVPIGGEIGRLLCNGKTIELASKEFDDGHIVTKEFGRVKILFSSSLTQTGMAIYLTDKQKKALSDYASKQ